MITSWEILSLKHVFRRFDPIKTFVSYIKHIIFVMYAVGESKFRKFAIGIWQKPFEFASIIAIVSSPYEVVV